MGMYVSVSKRILGVRVSLGKQVKGRDKSPEEHQTEGKGTIQELTDIAMTGWLCLGVFVMPFIFTWLTLRKKHGYLLRACSFSWLALVSYAFYSV